MACRNLLSHVFVNIRLGSCTHKLAKPIARTLFVTSCKKRENLEERVGNEVVTAQATQVPTRPPLPLYTSRQLSFPSKFEEPLQAWVSNMDTLEDQKLGIIDLHPEVFAVIPKIHMIHENVKWQTKYRYVDWTVAKTRAEMPGGGRKPWPQKGTGRARHGSIRSPLWKSGGKAHGPRGPKPYFYMLNISARLHGLTSTLSAKFAQDDCYIVDSLEIPSDEQQYIEQLVEKRNWGLSVLFVDDTDFMPRNITLATDKIPQYTLMPTYGLNVFSMLKYETLVLTVAAVEKLEERILYHYNRLDIHQIQKKFSRIRRPQSPLMYAHLLKDHKKE